MFRYIVKQDYSIGKPKILEESERLRVARQIFHLLNKQLVGKNLNDSKVLDIGCSSGVISSYLADKFGSVVGIDIDKSALAMAQKIEKPNLKVHLMDASKMKFRDESFDIVILSQVHYYFKNRQKLFDEVYRVLKPRGIVFLSGTNKLRIKKPFEPVPTYYESFWELKKLLRKFKIFFYSKDIASMRWPVLKFVPDFVWNRLEPLAPNFVWILEKEQLATSN